MLSSGANEGLVQSISKFPFAMRSHIQILIIQGHTSKFGLYEGHYASKSQCFYIECVERELTEGTCIVKGRRLGQVGYTMGFGFYCFLFNKALQLLNFEFY